MFNHMLRRSFKISITNSTKEGSHSRAICVTVLFICIAFITPIRVQAAQTLPPGFVPAPDHGIKHCIFEISKPIDKSTLAFVKIQYEQAERYAASKRGTLYSCPFGHPVVWLNSLGGDVSSAMEIGRFLRSKNANVIVPSGAHCASACVLVLLGGVQRSVAGYVGIHRPYGMALSDSIEKSESSYRKVNALLKSYMLDLRIPLDLLHKMNSIPPEKIKWLTLDECKALRICGDDPAWKDYQDSQLAEKLGISKATLYKRREIAHKVCEHKVKWLLCTNNIVTYGHR